MMSYFSEKFSELLVSKDIIPNDDKEVVEYGSKIIFSTLGGIIYILFLGLILKQAIVSMVFLFTMTFLKLHMGGYHAKSYFSCTVITMSIFLLSLFLYKHLCFMMAPFWFLFGIASFIIVFIFAPCKSPGKYYTKKLIKKLRLQSSITVACFLLGALLLCVFELDIYKYIIILMFIASTNLLLGKMKGGREDEQKDC